MAALGKLVAGLAHEMNTPLGTLASSADVADRSRRIIHERVEDAEGERLRDDPRFLRALRALDEGVVNLKTASERIDELVTGLRSFSQLDKAEFQRTDLNDGLRATVSLLENQVPEGVELEVELGETEPILGYPAQLNQLFLGLIRHAVRDVTPPGRVRVETTMDGDSVVVTVEDTGCGYDPDELKALFNPGFGTGAGRVRMDWGLVTCHRIVDRHGGTLESRSRPGEGTTYRIAIPVRSIPPEGADASVV
jgi:signal transduction histidine kinase